MTPVNQAYVERTIQQMKLFRGEGVRFFSSSTTCVVRCCHCSWASCFVLSSCFSIQQIVQYHDNGSSFTRDNLLWQRIRALRWSHRSFKELMELHLRAVFCLPLLTLIVLIICSQSSDSTESWCFWKYNFLLCRCNLLYSKDSQI